MKLPGASWVFWMRSAMADAHSPQHSLMKTLHHPALRSPLAAALLMFSAVGADTAPAGYVDFGALKSSSSNTRFVEVNLKGGLLSMATRLARSQEPEIGDLLAGLKQVRVNVVGLGDDNRAGVQRQSTRLHEDLEARGWDRIVSVQKGNQRDDVAIYIKTRNDEAVEGVVVTVMKGNKEAVFVNIVGTLEVAKLAKIGEKLDIEPLKHLGVPEKVKNP